MNRKHTIKHTVTYLFAGRKITKNIWAKDKEAALNKFKSSHKHVEIIELTTTNEIKFSHFIRENENFK